MSGVNGMSTEIAVSLITLLGTIIGTFTGIFVNSKLVNYRLARLEEKVGEQNRVVERVYRLEQSHAVLRQELKDVEHRIRHPERAWHGEDPYSPPQTHTS